MTVVCSDLSQFCNSQALLNFTLMMIIDDNIAAQSKKSMIATFQVWQVLTWTQTIHRRRRCLCSRRRSTRASSNRGLTKLPSHHQWSRPPLKKDILHVLWFYFLLLITWTKLCNFLSLSHTHTLSRSLSLYLSVSLICLSHSFSPLLSFSLPFSCSLSLSFSLFWGLTKKAVSSTWVLISS